MDPDLLFGIIAVKNNLLTEILVDECLGIQKQLEAKDELKTLGAILLEKGYLNHDEVVATLQLQNKYLARENDILYGKIAIKNGLITKNQILSCLDYQAIHSPNDKIGEILVQKKFISFRDHCAILKAQTRIRSKQTV